MNRFIQAFIERDAGTPAEQGFGESGVGEEPADFAGGGSNAGGIGFDRDRPAHAFGDSPDEFADRKILSATDVDRSTDGRVASRDRDESGDGVRNERQVSPGVEASEPNGASDEGLADDGRNDRAGRLTRSEGIERPEDRHRQAERSLIRDAQGVGGDLGRRIGRLALKRMVLVDRHPERRAVNLGGGGRDQTLKRRAFPAGVEHVRGAENVGLDDVVGMFVRVGNGDQGAEMKDPAAALNRSLDGDGIFEVAPNDFDLIEHVARQTVEMAAIVSTVISDERSNAPTVPRQPLGQMTADKSARPGHQIRFAHRPSPIALVWFDEPTTGILRRFLRSRNGNLLGGRFVDRRIVHPTHRQQRPQVFARTGRIVLEGPAGAVADQRAVGQASDKARNVVNDRPFVQSEKMGSLGRVRQPSNAIGLAENGDQDDRSGGRIERQGGRGRFLERLVDDRPAESRPQDVPIASRLVPGLSEMDRRRMERPEPLLRSRQIQRGDVQDHFRPLDRFHRAQLEIGAVRPRGRNGALQSLQLAHERSFEPKKANDRATTRPRSRASLSETESGSAVQSVAKGSRKAYDPSIARTRYDRPAQLKRPASFGFKSAFGTSRISRSELPSRTFRRVFETFQRFTTLNTGVTSLRACLLDSPLLQCTKNQTPKQPIWPKKDDFSTSKRLEAIAGTELFINTAAHRIEYFKEAVVSPPSRSVRRSNGIRRGEGKRRFGLVESGIATPMQRNKGEIVRKTAISDPEPGSIGLNGSGEDRLVAQAVRSKPDSLRGTEEQDLFFTLSLDMLCTANLEGYFLRLNPAWERTLGYEIEELLAEPFLNFVHPADRASTIAAVERLTGGDELIAFENRYRCRDGTYKWLLWNAVPVPGRDRIYAVAHDITTRKNDEAELRRLLEELSRSNRQLKRMADDLANTALSEHQAHAALLLVHEELKAAQVQLVQAEKLVSMGQMVAGVAHEINNPLSFIGNNVAVLRRDIGLLRELLALYRSADPTLAVSSPELYERIRDRAERIDLDYTLDNLVGLTERSAEGLKRIQGIVADLRDFARLDEGDLKTVDLNDGIRSTVNVVAYRARMKNVELIMELGALPEFICSPGKINQVVLNLLVNAIDACSEGGKVTIRTLAAERRLEIHVLDTGPGVDPAVRDRIFDPFFTTKPVGQGTGLGLSISHGIIQAHGGSIVLESDREPGAHFVVRLPLGSE